MVPLSSLALRQPARIVDVGGGRSFRRRLMELGFLPGAEVTLLGVAPMGDPLDLELRGCRYSLRRAEADAIGVEPRGARAAASPATSSA